MTVSAKRQARVELKSTFDPKGVQEARRALRQEQREQSRQAKQAERDGKRMRKEMLGAGRNVLGGVGQGMQMAFGFQALGGIEGAARGVFDFNEQLMRFQLAARKTPAEAAEIGAAARQVAVETGIAAEAVLAGERAYVDRAGAEHASIESMRMLARTAQASGAAIGDMATVVYSLENALHVKPTEMEDVIGGLINQSKDGTIHFQNMAEEIIALAPKFARFGVTGREGAAQLGAMLQIAGTGFKDAAEASTGIQGLFRGLTLHADKFQKAGINVFQFGKNGAKSLRPFMEIVHDISKSKLMRDPQLLLKDIGRGEGYSQLNLMVEGSEKAEQLYEAAMANGVVQRDLATVTESTSGRMAIAMEKAKTAFAEAFTPERIKTFADAIAGLADNVEPVAEVLGKMADIMGTLYNAGKKLRELAGDDGRKRYSPEDVYLVNYTRSRGLDENNPRFQAAARHMQEVDEYNATREKIAGALGPNGEVTGKAREIAADAATTHNKYNTDAGARLAGEDFLQNTKSSKDAPDPWASATVHGGGGQIDLKKFAEATASAMASALQRVGIMVKVGAEPVAKAVKNSRSNNRNPGARE